MYGYLFSGRYIPWIVRLAFVFWVGWFGASLVVNWSVSLSAQLALHGISQSAFSFFIATLAALIFVASGEGEQFKNRREVVVRREADARQLDTLSSAGADAFEAALKQLGFVRRGDCASTKGPTIIRRRIFGHSSQACAAALTHVSTINKEVPGPLSLSMFSLLLNGFVVTSRSVQPGEKPLKPTAKEIVFDVTDATPEMLFDAQVKNTAAIAAEYRTRPTDLTGWSAYAMADPLDDAWARRLESLAWSPAALRNLRTDIRWLADQRSWAGVATIAAVLILPSLLFGSLSGFLHRSMTPQPADLPDRTAEQNAATAPVYPGARLLSHTESDDPAAHHRRLTDTYAAAAPIDMVRGWYAGVLPSSAKVIRSATGGSEVAIVSNLGSRIMRVSLTSRPHASTGITIVSDERTY